MKGEISRAKINTQKSFSRLPQENNVNILRQKEIDLPAKTARAVET